MLRGVRLILACGLATACLLAAALPAGAQAQPPAVYVFPIPGGRVASPDTQITFRGVPASQLGPITVVGSESGVHTGTIEADSDGHGGSFLPTTPFMAGEIVTVTTTLNVVGSANGVYQFGIATPAGGLSIIHWPAAPRVAGDVWTWRSQPGFVPAAAKILKAGPSSPGDIFVAPQYGPIQDGPEILAPNGSLIWFDPLYGDASASDFRVQTYHGQSVLTWWQGDVTAGAGVGVDVIYNERYQPVAAVHAGNGLSADLHEFQLTSQGTALITAYYPVWWNTSSIRGPTRQVVFDAVVQEIDIPTGLVLFQWDSLDHVPVTDTYESLPRSTRSPFDYFHVNSIQVDLDGNYLISGRNTWAAYKVNSNSGAVMWELGGRQSSFKMGRGTSFAFQHDVRDRAYGDEYVTLFDDGGGPPTVHSQSRALELRLSLRNMTATLGTQREHSPALASSYEGNDQQLPDFDDFVGWGEQPYFTEYTPWGSVDLDGRFVGNNATYRAYRFPWTGTPATPPSIAVTGGAKPVVYASWNGATTVAAWHVLGGATPSTMRYVAGSIKLGFETSIRIPKGLGSVTVQAMDSRNHVIGTSAIVSVP